MTAARLSKRLSQRGLLKSRQVERFAMYQQIGYSGDNSEYVLILDEPGLQLNNPTVLYRA